MKNLILILMSVLVISSCSKEDTNLNSFYVFGFDDYDTATKELGAYAELGVYYDGLTKVTLRQLPAMENETKLYGEVVNLYSKDATSELENVGDFYIGEIKSIFDSNKKSYIVNNYPNNSLDLGNKVKDILGNNTTFKLEKNDNVIFEKEIYIPEELEIAFENQGKQENTSRYFIDRNKFDVSWNKDEGNNNKLLVAVSWFGEYMDTSLGNINKKDEKIINALVLEETGAVSMPSDLFQGIPENAVVTITFLRGEVSSALGTDNISYQIQALSEVQYRLILN